MADNSEKMAANVEQKKTFVDEESGGVVTTVKKATTSDLDVQETLAQQAKDEKSEDAKEEADADGKSVAEPEKETPKGKAAKQKDDGDDDGDDEKLDFNSLPPAQKKAVASLYKERRAAKRELREMRDQLADLQTKIAARPAREAAPVVERTAAIEKPKRPRPEDYIGKDAEYDAAVDKYDEDMYKVRRAQEKAEAELRAQMDTDAKTVMDFTEAAEAFAEEHPDYDEVMDNDIPMTGVMFGAVLENGPALGYWLASNPKKAIEISKMTDRQADKEIMRIVVKLEEDAAGKKAKPKGEAAAGEEKQNKKPDPPNALAGRGNARPADDKARPKSFRDREKEFAKNHPGFVTYDT